MRKNTKGKLPSTILANSRRIDCLSGILLWPALPRAQRAILGLCCMPSRRKGTQTRHCRRRSTIVAESGAKFELRDRNRDGHVDSVELSNKALLLEVPKKPGRARFDVVTPQAIAAVRGTKWAVDAEGAKTSVFVVDGRVSVARPPAAAASYSAPVTASMSSHRAT
jgi:hypothetical protein